MKQPFIEHDTYFSLCAWCDTDKNITKGLLALEDVREFEAKRRGITDHVRKFVSHGICRDCKEEVLNAVRDYAPKK